MSRKSSSGASFRLYNTLSRTVEAIDPAEPGHLRFYACGPTVYSYAHIGNFRSFLTADLIARTAHALGWRTSYVSNITDVGHLTEDDIADAAGEDKMAKALRSKEGERFANIWDLARYYTDAFLSDWKALNLLEPDVRPRASEHMRQQIQAIERLIEQGHAYETDRGVYFSVERFPDYGKLSGNRAAEDLEAGAAAASRDLVEDPEKRDPRDFALWKKDESHLMQWHSPWGWGFPGWHIECSAMSMEYLGEELDLHAGGEDLIFPHHECEIAQSESLTSKPLARYWVHTRFLQVEGEKMSKSAGNYHTVRDLIASDEEGGRGIDPLALRLALISGQYRKPFNFTFDTLRSSARHVQRFQEADQLVQRMLEEDIPGEDIVGDRLDALYGQTLDAMCDDLNTPAAVAAVLEGIKLIHGIGNNLNTSSVRKAASWLDQVNDLLGIIRPHEAPAEPARSEDPLAKKVESLLQQRAEARSARNFDRADAIRDQLEDMGIEVMDTADGTSWRRKISV